MLILGIDPGFAICGYGLVESKNSRLLPKHYGAVTTSKDMAAEMRLAAIYQELDALAKEYRPDVMAIEQLFFNTNATTAISVGQARGAILLVAAHNNIQVVEYTPLQVKQAVVGYGKATKEQVTIMVQRLLAIKTKPKPDDVTDALAIAICAQHSLGSGNARLMAMLKS